MEIETGLIIAFWLFCGVTAVTVVLLTIFRINHDKLYYEEMLVIFGFLASGPIGLLAFLITTWMGLYGDRKFKDSVVHAWGENWSTAQGSVPNHEYVNPPTINRIQEI